MKKLIFACLLFPFLSLAQSTFDLNNVGNDESNFLNEDEINYTHYLLNHLYEDSIFNLNQKKTLFVSGNYGAQEVSKSFFFNTLSKPWTVSNDQPHIQIIVLTAQEAEAIGYDIILVAWSKIPPEGRARKKFIMNAMQMKSA